MSKEQKKTPGAQLGNNNAQRGSGFPIRLPMRISEDMDQALANIAAKEGKGKTAVARELIEASLNAGV